MFFTLHVAQKYSDNTFESLTGDGITILRGHPSFAKAYHLQGKGSSFTSQCILPTELQRCNPATVKVKTIMFSIFCIQN